MASSYLFLSLCFFKIVMSMDFYAGVFNKNDFLVAQDNLYKGRVPYRVTQSMYGRYFKCPITYFRVVDRLGVGRGPRVQVTRGGLRHRFLTLRISSPYNMPTSVTILVGCENKKKLATKPPTTVPPGGSTPVPAGGSTPVPPGGSTSVPSGGNATAAPDGNATPAPDGGSTPAPGVDATKDLNSGDAAITTEKPANAGGEAATEATAEATTKAEAAEKGAGGEEVGKKAAEGTGEAAKVTTTAAPETNS